MAMPRSAGSTSLTTLPPMAISPPVMSSRPAIIRSSVDLPQPEGPTKTTNSPSLDVEVGAMDDLEDAEALDDIAE